MLFTWKSLGLPMILTAVLAAIPSLALAAEPPPAAEPAKPEAVAKDLADIKSRLTEMQTSLGELHKALAALAGMKVKVENIDFQSDKIQTLEKQIVQLQQEVKELRKRLPAEPFVVRKPTEESAAGTGVVRLVNTYSSDVRVLVNGKLYVVPPGEFRVTDPIPAGSFNYEVLGIQAPRTPTLQANKIFTITIHP